MQSPIKDQLRSLLKREIRFDTLQNSRLEVVSKQSSNSPISTSFTSPNITSDISTRDVAAQWLHEVVNDSKSPLDVFLLAVTLMDKFLELEPKVTKTQVQLCASACLLIASKLRIKDDHPLLTETQIVQYTDHSIDKTELKAWELLVLSKLDWDVNFVVALDYLEPLDSLLNPQAESNELEKSQAELICSLARYATFRAIYSPQVMALASFGQEKSYPDDLLPMLCIQADKLTSCIQAFKVKSTPLNSPFKAESTSTPKRNPLGDLQLNSPSIEVRRRLSSLQEDNNKENNDSAILLNDTNTTSTPTNSSKASSKQSSPDSGASSGGSPKLSDLEKLIENTHI